MVNRRYLKVPDILDAMEEFNKDEKESRILTVDIQMSMLSLELSLEEKVRIANRVSQLGRQDEMALSLIG